MPVKIGTKASKGARLKDIQLPTVTVEGDCESVAKALTRVKGLTPEAMVEVMIYIKREKAKASELYQIEEAMKAQLAAYYDKTKKDKRESIRASDVGMCSYSPPGEKVTIKDRDKAVEALTAEQIRISYIPDVKHLETILKKADFDRLVNREDTAYKLSIRDSKGDKYEELEF